MNKNEFESAIKSNPIVLVKFEAEWCGPCRALGPVVDQFIASNPDVKLVKVDVDDSIEVATDAVINAVPTLIFYKDGEETTPRIRGLTPKAELQLALDRLKQ